MLVFDIYSQEGQVPCVYLQTMFATICKSWDLVGDRVKSCQPPPSPSRWARLGKYPVFTTNHNIWVYLSWRTHRNMISGLGLQSKFSRPKKQIVFSRAGENPQMDLFIMTKLGTTDHEYHLWIRRNWNCLLSKSHFTDYKIMIWFRLYSFGYDKFSNFAQVNWPIIWSRSVSSNLRNKWLWIPLIFFFMTPPPFWSQSMSDIVKSIGNQKDFQQNCINCSWIGIYVRFL